MKQDKENLKRLNNKLSRIEFDVIELKSTEPPFSGEYCDNKSDGTYICRRCSSPLYHSKDKFHSGCGWPSFDDKIEGAVLRKPDADGRRTEILCASCGAHLGHVFSGEGFTEKNTRHCVNSVSMRFIPERGETGRAVFAGGCFWGVESLFKRLDGVISTTVGYTGGGISFPSYEDVCHQNAGHIEAVEVFYDPVKIGYRDLAKYFFEIHDPTQNNGQGLDIGEQYMSVIFYENDSQEKSVTELVGILKTKGLDVVTELRPIAAFWPAEDYHQDYYQKTGKAPYCHTHLKRFD